MVMMMMMSCAAGLGTEFKTWERDGKGVMISFET
jgi:hypothetical protein